MRASRSNARYSALSPRKRGERVRLTRNREYFVPGLPLLDEVVFRLSDERLQCLRKHAAVYRAVKGDRLFIALAECPKLRARPGLSLLVNQGRSENRTNASAGRILYVTKAQFECLIRSRVARAPTYRFFPDTCRLERAE